MTTLIRSVLPAAAGRWASATSRFLVASALAPGLAACPNPNTYGTPRTLPAGKVQGFASLESLGAIGAGTSVPIIPTLPSMGAR